MELYHQPESPRLGAVIRGRCLAVSSYRREARGFVPTCSGLRRAGNASEPPPLTAAKRPAWAWRLYRLGVGLIWWKSRLAGQLGRIASSLTSAHVSAFLPNR